MMNKFFFLLVFVFLNLTISQKIYGAEQFNFDVTEVEILEDGNLFKGLKRGTVTTNDGVIINADQFEYNKLLNILKANGNVEMIDSFKDYKIYSQAVTYLKNKEIIFSKGESKA